MSLWLRMSARVGLASHRASGGGRRRDWMALPRSWGGIKQRVGVHSGQTRQRIAFGANPLLSVPLPAWRSRLTLGVLFLAFLVLTVRAVSLQGGGRTDFLQRQGEARYARTLEVPATRGKVTDRHGAVLAASVPARAIWAIPEDVRAGDRPLGELARLLGRSTAELKQLLASDRSFVYLRRQVDMDVAQRIAQLKIEGVHASPEYKRHYPEGRAMAHVVGFTNVEDRGQEGVERAFEPLLAGRVGSRRVIKDRLGRVVEDDWLRMPVDGHDVVLSIDRRIQHIAVSALTDALKTHDAKAGSVVVLDARTGEVLALANAPSFDPNERSRLRGGALRNRALTDTFEPGSTLKPFSIAAALDAGRVTPRMAIQTGEGRLRIGRRSIGDTHAHGVLTVSQVVAKSSNVGTAKIALELPSQTLWETYTRAGFGQVPESVVSVGEDVKRGGLSGAVAGRLRPYQAWRPIEQATISYGYGVSVSLLQLARAYTVFARDGDIIPITLTRSDEPAQGRRVVSVNTARAMRRMLEAAVSEEGTAPKARALGYRVAGKTGTARKAQDGRYSGAYVASFAGFAPVSDPRLVIAVMIDEPNYKRAGGHYYGGDVAAPVFSQIVSQALRVLQVAPDALGPEFEQGPAMQLVQASLGFAPERAGR
ncbi:MAG TPA: penicillin-binding protein 2 [Burkholderiaceae bacterium]|nr:penicillin-binding protein 2 [Burkholderiaceae bacterium]